MLILLGTTGTSSQEVANGSKKVVALVHLTVKVVRKDIKAKKKHKTESTVASTLPTEMQSSFLCLEAPPRENIEGGTHRAKPA